MHSLPPARTVSCRTNNIVGVQTLSAPSCSFQASPLPYPLPKDFLSLDWYLIIKLYMLYPICFFHIQAWINIASSRPYLFQNLYILLVVLSCCLYQIINTLPKMMQVFYTGRTLLVDVLFQLSLKVDCLNVDYFSCQPEVDHHQQWYPQYDDIHDC